MNMTQSEKRKYLIQYLLDENKRYKEYEIPTDAGEQKSLLRALMNVRMPDPISEDFLNVQDEYLKEDINRMNEVHELMRKSGNDIVFRHLIMWATLVLSLADELQKRLVNIPDELLKDIEVARQILTGEIEFAGGFGGGVADEQKEKSNISALQSAKKAGAICKLNNAISFSSKDDINPIFFPSPIFDSNSCILLSKSWTLFCKFVISFGDKFCFSWVIVSVLEVICGVSNFKKNSSSVIGFVMTKLQEFESLDTVRLFFDTCFNKLVIKSLISEKNKK